MRKLIYAATAAILASLAGCEKYALDRQMAELCKKDGGLEVYETVTLPRSAFDATGRVIRQRFTDQSKPFTSFSIVTGGVYSITNVETKIVGDEVGTGFVKKGRLLRFEDTVQRISDKKVLGTQVSYGRTGGEVSLGHPSSNHCPRPRISPDLESTIFKKEK